MSKKKDKNKKKAERPYASMAVSGTAGQLADTTTLGRLVASVSAVTDQSLVNAMQKAKALGLTVQTISSPTINYHRNPKSPESVHVVASVTLLGWRYTDVEPPAADSSDDLPPEVDELLGIGSEVGAKIELKEVQSQKAGAGVDGPGTQDVPPADHLSGKDGTV